MSAHLNRRAFGLLAGAAAAGIVCPRTVRAAPSGQIVVGTWGGDYQNLLQQNVAVPLMTPMGVNVVYDTATDTVRKTKLMAERRLPRGSMDVAALTASGSFEMYSNGALEELDEGKVPNLQHVQPFLKSKYAAPHIYTGRVILYNPKLIPEKPTSYADLWKPEYAGKVGLIDLQYQTTIESAAMIAGGSMTNYEPGKAKLLELKKRGVKIYPTNEAMAQALKTEECAICIMWLARGVAWQKAGIPVEIAYPKEGVVLYISDMVVPKNARNKDAAFAYLNAILEPTSQEAFARTMGYAPTVDNVTLAPALAKQVSLPADLQSSFAKQDQDYLLKTDASLQEWWTKEFKS
ncbi:ABC transporter substrate-binding protein [Methylobacterium terricola]|uniref:ABC transporter substrate-binding protein n=1 Tax=Methylobacterium terricola TaxID=2583531 RepID=A0A5C4LAK1_9HYPH|nr:ABC transporter substrate-binding protein [Methylobacterium terricola]TNC08337.1 ABC transporter substrate-binding protein [Methylobacterium terricola]